MKIGMACLLPAQAGRRQARYPARFLRGFSTAVVTISFALPSVAGAAGITQIAFTSPFQTIEPSVASARITIEAQDAVGEAVRGSTVCVQVTSSSGSGEFSTNAESWSAEPIKKLALTISSNQYRRNFYYRDGGEGTLTLLVKAGLRADGSTCTEWKGTPTWSASQQITVDKNAAAIVAARDAELAAPSVPKTESKVDLPSTKKKTTKFVSKAEPGDATEETAADPLDIATVSVLPTERPQMAAAGFFSDSLWWVAALGLIGAGCVAVVLSKKSAKQEWNIIEQKED